MNTYTKSQQLKRNPKKKKKRKPKIGNVKTATWNMFSQMIRIYEGILTTGDPNRAICCTCGEVFDYDQLHAGHFIPQRHNNILFDVRGVHAQCSTCNTGYGGEPVKYHAYMLKNYSQKVIDELNEQNHTTKTFLRQELLDMRKEYKERIKQMLRESPIQFKYSLQFMWDGK